MLGNYFLKGLSFDDFQDYLVFIYCQDEVYAKALRDSFEEELKKYI